jgi:hypothetical protein
VLDLLTPAINLWNNFQKVLSADFSINHNEHEAIQLTLEDISHYLYSQDSSLQQYRLSELVRIEWEINIELDIFTHS